MGDQSNIESINGIFSGLSIVKKLLVCFRVSIIVLDGPFETEVANLSESNDVLVKSGVSVGGIAWSSEAN